MKYKKGDKVVVEIDKEDADMLNGGHSPSYLYFEQFLGKLEDFTESKKIKMTEAEKKEFDLIHEKYDTLLQAFLLIGDDFPNLNRLLFGSKSRADNNLGQLKLAKAWASPYLIEVVEPEKHLVTLPNGQYVAKAEVGTYRVYSDDPQNYDKLTKEEVYEAEKQLRLTGLVELWKKAGKQED